MGHELGLLWVKPACPERLMWRCQRELVFLRSSDQSLVIYRGWGRQHQARALRLAGWNRSLGWWVAAHGERAGFAVPGRGRRLLFSLVVIFSLQSCGRREGLRWEGAGKFPFGFEENLCKRAWCCSNPGPNYKACGSQRAQREHRVQTQS